ncbi:MAG: thiamine pyrophosphate-dependent enzyme [Candidatus Omnitrophota bacterium]|nr:thiamine pyrophosphate-dependent enzyme [Candidatus Omnitrophota bacterium]
MDKVDFQNVIVNKPWGYEYLIFQNDEVAIWYLHIRYGAATSLHCHPTKKTGMIVLAGEVDISFLKDSTHLSAVTKLIIRPGLFHSTKAVSQGGAILLEVETAGDKDNLVRFQDQYGRQGKPYEGEDKMEAIPEEYIRFKQPLEGKPNAYHVQGRIIMIEKLSDLSLLKKRPGDDTIAVLGGALTSEKGEVLVGPGEVGSLDSLVRVASVFPAPRGMTLLTIQKDKHDRAAQTAQERRTERTRNSTTRDRGPELGLIKGLSKSFSVPKTLDIFRQTCINRYFEIEAAKAYDKKLMKMPIYLSVGQEHIPAAIATVATDFMIFAQHRCHSYYLSFGGDPKALIDELLHRESGCARGMGGSASIHDPRIGMFGHSGLMGDQVPIAVGAALGSGKNVLAVTGDASVEEDYVYGAMGYAATKKIPVLFICEDNDLSILTKVEKRRSWSMADVCESLGMKAVDIADDPWLIAHYVEKFLNTLPAFINIRTCRHLWHAGTGNDGAPEWNRFELFKKKLKTLGLATEVKKIETAARESMESLWQEQLRKQ